MSVNSPRTRYPAELPTGTEVASYARYEDAAAAVDTLQREGFPLASVTIAGSDLHLIEKVMGKLTPARVALTGAGQGLTWGLLMGIFSILALPQGGSIVALIAVSIGILAGVLISVVMWATSTRKRTFFSHSAMVASRYAILVTEQVDRAYSILAGARGNTAPRPQRPTRLAQNDRTPRTYSDAQKESGAKASVAPNATDSSRGSGNEPKKRSTLEPPKFGVRLDDAQRRESSESTSDSGQSEPENETPKG
ncbi:general stress protein [Actinomycetaceae bacterium MB13-C1-2]|nr:general stress protein [Actinomycetaceae bacterium MB13-C1-2]